MSTKELIILEMHFDVFLLHNLIQTTLVRAGCEKKSVVNIS